MPSRFTQYGGAAGADMALQQMVAERIAAQLEARKHAVETYKLQQQDRQIGQGDRRMDIDVQQHGDTHGLNVEKLGQQKTEFEAGAPQREAQTGYLRTQTRDLEQKPLYAEQTRQANEARDKTQHGYRLGEIAAQSANRGDDLANFEAKEQIKAKYGGSRPSLGAERQTLAYFNRAKQASEDLVPLEDAMAKAGTLSEYQLQYAPNIAQTGEQQRYRQGQRAFTEARLRKESGAAIPTAEYENDSKTYFAQPGDDETTKAQKRAARQAVLDGLKFAAGKAYEEFYGEPNQPPAQQQRTAPPSQEFDFVPGKGLVPRGGQ